MLTYIFIIQYYLNIATNGMVDYELQGIGCCYNSDVRLLVVGEVSKMNKF